jgi:peroxiredoxin
MHARNPHPVAAAFVLFLVLNLLAPGTGDPAHGQESPATAAEVVPGSLNGVLLQNLPAPEFRLTTLSGDAVSLDTYAGWILVLYFFDSEGPETATFLREMAFFRSQGREREIAYLGVSRLPRETLASLVKEQGFEGTIAHDPEGLVTERYLGEKGAGLFVIDHQRTVRLAREDFDIPVRQSLRRLLSALLRDLHRTLWSLPQRDLRWRTYPAVPSFEGVDLEGNRHTSAQYRGKPLLVTFLERECDFCRKLAPKLSEVVLRYQKRGIQFLGVATEDPRGDLARQMAIQGLAFPVLLDPDRKIRQAFGSLRGNPDLFWIDAKGRVRWREFGVPEDIGTILDLEARVLLGEADPADIPGGEYLGHRYCRVCHEPQFEDWLRTPHAVAFLSVASDQDWTRPQCVSCHVTGYQEPGGYQDAQDAERSHVQCEACHGRGGGHGSGEEGARKLVARCTKCHAGQYSLQQDLKTSLSWMSHNGTPEPATMFAYLPERIQDMQRLGPERRSAVTFHRGTEYVGSERCAPCHEEIHRWWSTTAHATALDTLRDAGSQSKPECLSCHTTALGILSGYRGASTPSLAAVGCEACHGPGAEHVAAGDQATAASIYGLRSDCADCRAEALCRDCHDPENDPDFRMPKNPGKVSHPPARK